MSTHKHFDKICCVVLAFALILTALFMNAEAFGIEKATKVMGYEETLFDTSRVHTIDIVMDDWEDFIDNCTSEEYYDCSVIIDDEAYKNVAIRGKGNTSLSQVSSYGNDRYSFKIEFDHYDDTNTYYGLDKLCLNNIIQDNTYMKDYLTYQMMNEMGIAAPLCSYVYITVNGQDWGLYLAVEGVEESFLERNYGSDYGELYKPDSMNMGGGRGNGMDFNMDDFFNNSDSENTDNGNTQNDSSNQNQGGMPNMELPEGIEGMPNMELPEGMEGMPNMELPEGMENLPNMESFDGMTSFGNGSTNSSEGKTSNGFGGNRGFGKNRGSGSNGNQSQSGIPNMELPEGMTPPTDGDTENSNGFGNMFGGKMPGGMGGSDDVLLKYIDDEIESYSNIFDSAKTDITDTDKTRLIDALKNLSNGEDLENTVEIENVIKYFVVHNFVLNFDSYTGSMIHNYYLYEEDGQMQMIPWDYNLAFGGFQSASDATSLVNYPIDSPISGGDTGDRPMIAWIFENEEYTELYHEYFNEFISEYFDSGKFEEMIDNVTEMISPYVEKDPTKFCSYEEFKIGAATLKEFCLLRAESISGQLNGTIGSTSETQKNDTLINATNIQVSDMGSMGNGMGGNKDRFNNNMQQNEKPSMKTS